MTLRDEARQNKEVVRYLISRFRENQRWLILSLLLAALNATVFVYLLSRVRPFVDEALGQKNWDKAIQFAVSLVVLFFLQGLTSFGQRMSLRLTVERTVKKIRNELFEKLLVLSQSQSQLITSGKTVNYILSDVFVVGGGLLVLADLILQPFTIVAITCYLLWLNWQLCLVCLVCVPIVGVVGRKVGGSARRNQYRLQARLEQISNHIIETLRGLRLAHAFGQTPKLKREFEDQVDKSYRHQLKLNALEESIGPSNKVITAFGGAILSLYGFFLVKHGMLTTGELTAFLLSAGSLSQPMRTLNDVTVKLQMVIAAASRIYAFIAAPLDTLGEDQSKALNMPAMSVAQPVIAQREARLEMQNLSYHYSVRGDEEKASSEWALENINFTLEPGRKIALVGASGAGKSTLSYLAMRFLDPTEGRVMLAGRDAREWDLREYRAAFSYVSQDVFLFNRTVRENVLFARESASDTEVLEALERANIRDFVESLPQGLDTPLGEQASKLSGGEKQRLSIARAFLRNAPILVLDEATSQLDAQNERAVQRALNDLMKSRSAIIIAHRLSTIREVDEIFVMNQGRIVERGAPSELVEREEGHFRTLWRAQQMGPQ